MSRRMLSKPFKMPTPRVPIQVYGRRDYDAIDPIQANPRVGSSLKSGADLDSFLRGWQAFAVVKFLAERLIHFFQNVVLAGRADPAVVLVYRHRLVGAHSFQDRRDLLLRQGLEQLDDKVLVQLLHD